MSTQSKIERADLITQFNHTHIAISPFELLTEPPEEGLLRFKAFFRRSVAEKMVTI
jgi:hypothetical protein